MLEEEAKLQTRYYELSAQAADYQDDTQGYYDDCADGMASLLAELIAVRQEIAEYCGYSDYPQFAEDFYFYRDYTARGGRAASGGHPPGAGAAVPGAGQPMPGRRPVSTLRKGRPSTT